MPERTRTVSWEDPAESARRGMEMGGLDYIRAIHRGEIPAPPMAILLGFDLHEVEEGRVTFRAVPGEHLYNPMNSVHGGLALTMLDSAAGASVHTTLPQGKLYGSLETKVNMVRAIDADSGPLLAQGSVVHRGSKIATAEARLIGEQDDRLYAHGTSTCLILG
ncbi:MAG: PaaI family thioesterase [Actinomycetota bacterium]